MANKITVIIDAVTGQAKSSVEGFRKAVAEADGPVNKLKAGWGATLDSFKKSPAAQAAAVGAVAAVATASIHAASNLAESINAVNVAYGDAAEGVLALGEDSAESFGLSQRAFNEFAVQFSAFANQIAEKEGRSVSSVLDEMTTRVADFASVMNMDVAEAAQVFQSALAGETEPIRKFGVDLSAAAVAAHAVETGMVDSAKSMTEAQKVQARYSLLMQETNKVAGDFANTSGSLANATRIAQAKFEDLQATIGQALIPAAEKLIPVLSTAMDHIEGTAEQVGWLATQLGKVIGPMQRFGQAVNDALDEMGPFGEGVKKVGTYLIPVYGQLKLLSDGADLVKDAFGLNAEVNGKLTTSLSTLAEAQEAETEAIDGTATAIANARMEQNEYVGGLEEQARATDKAKKATEQSNWFLRKQADDAENASQKIDGLRQSHEELRGELADRSAYLDLQDAFDGVEQAAVEAYTAAAEGADDAEQKLRDAERAQIDLKQRVLDYVDSLDGIPPEVASDIVALIDEGKLAEAEAKLLMLTRQRFADIKVRLSGGTVTNNGTIDFGGGEVALDTGGPVPGPRGAPVPMVGHGGEFMLSADVVDAIKSGRQTRGLGNRQAAAVAPTASGLDLTALAQLIEAAVERGAARGTARGMDSQGARLAAGVRG